MQDEDLDIYGIVFGCPRQIRTKECPLIGVDILPLKKKYDFIKAMSSKEKEIIVKFHNTCIKKER